MQLPRLVIAGLAGGTGKTLVSLGLTRAFVRRGVRVQALKKGPDYIDTAWLGLASRGVAANLDAYLLPPGSLVSHFIRHAVAADITLVEGNRGLFDGVDLAGSFSTAELARTLAAPIILVVDCTKMTRTAAALVAGCKAFPGGERIAGVILNRTGGKRHAALVKSAVEDLAGLPVMGVIPRLKSTPILERRDGLITVTEHDQADSALEFLATVMTDHVDLDALLACGQAAAALDPAPEQTALPEHTPRSVAGAGQPRIGVVRDAAFWQYYPENLAALELAGARLLPVSLLSSEPLPPLDALYIGGGDIVPHLIRLAADTRHHEHIRALAGAGMPVYAEQAGYFYLAESIVLHGNAFPMAGVFPVQATVCASPQGLGYVEATCVAATPYFTAGQSCRGHEFRYLRVHKTQELRHVFSRTHGVAMGTLEDGICRGNCFGSAMQIFAPGVPGWAPAFVQAARAFQQ